MDSFRKEQKKKESKRAKETRDSAREIRDLLNDPSKIDQEIEKVQKESNENKLDKGLKDRIIELKRMKEVALQKQRIDAAQGKRVNKPEASSQSSAYGSQAIAQRAPGNAQYLQAQQQYNGLYGVPPGYAQPYGAAYPGGVIPQQYYGYPHPGGMMPVAMGGVNGIPLPPPRPPVAAAPGPPSSGAASAQRERKKRQDADFVDPLDPMASNYTERYGRKPERSSETVAQSHSQIPPAPQRAAQNPPIPSIPQTANREDEDEDDNDGEYDEETQRRLLQLTASYRQQEHHVTGETEIGPALPPNGHKRSRESDDGEEDNDDHAQKRGKKAPEDTMILPGMEFYADDDDEDDEGEDGNDSATAADDDADDADHKNRGGLAQNDEGDDDASAAVGPSMPQGFDSYQYDYSSYSAFPALMDPEEYLRQMQQQNEAENNEGQPQPTADRRDVWVEDGDDDDDGDLQASQPVPAPEPTPPADASLFPTVASTAVPSTLSAAPTAAPTSSSSATAAVHKADASLTAFLPSVLKKKVPAKKPGLVPRPPPSLPPPAAAATVVPASTAPVAEADEEYLRFMAEINELG